MEMQNAYKDGLDDIENAFLAVSVLLVCAWFVLWRCSQFVEMQNACKGKLDEIENALLAVSVLSMCAWFVLLVCGLSDAV